LNDESQAEGIARLRNEMALATTTRTASGKERVVAAQDDVLMATGYLVWAASRFGHALRRGTALAPRPAEFSAAAWT
jgi:hypothetical protein